jgi:hypothetical protein
MSDKPLKVLSGVNGQLELYQDKIVIKRKGMLSKMTQGFFKGEKTLFLSQITSIQVKQGGLLTNGYIQFSIGGGKESTRGILDATKDENTVMFTRGNNELVREIKGFIEKKIATANQPVSPFSKADEIMKLKELLDQGIITGKEFEAQKKQLLS